eukprot:TRINITY_DN9589_c0_g2_i1.p1 TRINITY_DN9589_c0_g2~~TRINITY_DN9589_c0_g2_i1.p1  ORF type:complete len:510 (+),score=130.54 TRINITY_DN9589_c0_g2_i1:118-1647(+)
MRNYSAVLVCCLLAVDIWSAFAVEEYGLDLIGSCVRRRKSNQGWELKPSPEHGISMTTTSCVGGGKCRRVSACSGDNCHMLVPCIRTKKRCFIFQAACCRFPLPERAPAITSRSQLVEPDHSARGDQVGANVAAAGNCLFIGAPADDSLNPNAGSVHVMCLNSKGKYRSVTKLYSSQADKKDGFGHHVTAFGNLVFVSAERDSTAADRAGAVYIFRATGADQWQQIQVLAPSTLRKKANFGASIAVEDGIAIIGAARVKLDGEKRAGQAYVYVEKEDKTWELLQVLVPKKPNKRDHCGASVAISGTFAVVGCPGRKTGKVIIYKMDKGRFEQVATIDEQDGQYGATVQIFSNEMRMGAPDITMAVAAPEADENNGVVHMYKLGSDGSVLKHQTLGYYDDVTLGGTDPLPVGRPHFGFGMSLSRDGKVLAVGAPEMADKDRPGGRGSLFVYQRQRDWSLTQRLHGKGPDTMDNLFGADVVVEPNLNGDGLMAVVGAPKLTSSGAVHVLAL